MTGTAKNDGFEKLNDLNYGDWAMMMEALLVRKTLWGIVNGTKTRPAGADTVPAVKTFIRNQAEARAELILHVETSQLPHMRKSDPNEIWEDLKKVHQARGLASKLALRRKFLWMKKTDDQSMSSWIADVRATAFRLGEIGSTIEDEDIILVLTQGLADSYDHFVVSLDATDSDKVDLDLVITRLMNEETRQLNSIEYKDRTAIAETSAFYAATNTKKCPLDQITCYKCGKKGHYQAQCPDNQKAGPVANAAFVAEEESDTDGVW